jgi:hypothetical protein
LKLRETLAKLISVLIISASTLVQQDMDNPTYVTPPQEAALARGSKILLKIIMTQILLELQSLDESKIERTLEGLSLI